MIAYIPITKQDASQHTQKNKTPKTKWCSAGSACLIDSQSFVRSMNGFNWCFPPFRGQSIHQPLDFGRRPDDGWLMHVYRSVTDNKIYNNKHSNWSMLIHGEVDGSRYHSPDMPISFQLFRHSNQPCRNYDEVLSKGFMWYKPSFTWSLWCQIVPAKQNANFGWSLVV